MSEVSDVGESSVADAVVAGRGVSRVVSGDGGGNGLGLWMGVGGAVSWVGGSCVPRRAEYMAWKGIWSNDASLELILIWTSSGRCRLFVVEVLSPWV